MLDGMEEHDLEERNVLIKPVQNITLAFRKEKSPLMARLDCLAQHIPRIYSDQGQDQRRLLGLEYASCMQVWQLLRVSPATQVTRSYYISTLPPPKRLSHGKDRLWACGYYS